MAKLNEQNPDSIRRRYSQQNRELALENALLRRQKRVLEQQVNLLQEHAFLLRQRIDLVEEYKLSKSTTDIGEFIRREMEPKRRPEPILSPIPESMSSPRRSDSPGTPPVVASLPEELETPTEAISEQGSVNVESRRRRKDNCKVKKITVFESPPREKSSEFSAITPIKFLSDSTTPPGEDKRSPIREILQEVAGFKTEFSSVAKKSPKKRSKSSRVSADDMTIPNVRSKGTGPKRRPMSTIPEIPKPMTKDTIISPVRPALGTRSINIDSPTKLPRRQKPKAKSDTSTPSITTTTMTTPTTITTTTTMTKNTTRARRASSTPVNYKEPNLVSKMRRPSATLVDAVPSSATGSNDRSRCSISQNSEKDDFILAGEN